MKCPFVCNKVKVVHYKPFKVETVPVVNSDQTDENIHLAQSDYTSTSTTYLHDCLEGDCAAWKDGQCRRI